MEQLPDVHHFFATCLQVVAEQVIDVSKIIIENIPSRRLCREPQLADQLVEVPTILTPSFLRMLQNVDTPVPHGGRGASGGSYLIPLCSGIWSTTSTFQFVVVVGVVDVSDAFVFGRSLCVVRDRAPQRFMEQNIRNFWVFKVYSKDKVLLRFLEQNFKVYPQDRVLLRFVEQNFKIF